MSDHIGDANKMISETPRTDEFDGEYSEWSPAKPKNWPAFSRQLERELNAANERIKRLEEAGIELLWAFCPASVSMMTERESDALKLWNKAKEDKL